VNVLLLTIDAWRTSHASFDPASTSDCTPELASLAEDGVVFTQAVSHGPATPYAFPGILTSTYPLDYGGYEELGDGRTVVSEPLSDAGWRCVGVHSNPWLGGKYGYDRGYDEYRDVGEFSLPLLDGAREVLVDRFGLDHPVYEFAQSIYRRLQSPLRMVGGGRTDEVSVARAAFEDHAESRPDRHGEPPDGRDLFVWAHLLAPHAPYTPPERHREAAGVEDVDATELTTRAQRDPGGLSDRERETVEGLYAASVRHADERAGRILDAVDDDTLVIVTADHGEALFEHDTVGHPPRLWDELVRVPLMVRPPGGADPRTDDFRTDDSRTVDSRTVDSESVDSRTVDAQVRHVDIAPTVLDYADVPIPGSYRGRSLRPALEGDSVPTRPAHVEVASTESHPGRIDPEALRIGVRTPARKLVFEDDELKGYDLRRDPEECRPVDPSSDEEWARLRRTLRDRRDDIAFETGSVEFDADTEERLRDLGYLE
jgi:arylsulfatase A-like enzyme